MRHFVIGLWVFFGVMSQASAQIMLGPMDDVEEALNRLSPGDEVILSDGMYELTERFSFTANGEAGAPIVIRAAEGARPHFHRPNARQNIWDVEGAEHVVIRGLTFSGGSAGLRVMGANHLTIEGCEIFDTADVALRLNSTGVEYESVRILRNHIHDTGGTGEGMYLGCNDDACRLANAEIAENYVHHTNADDVTQGDGIELKLGSYGCVIRDNVIHDTNYPCILGYGANGNGPENIVEGNVMWGCGDHGIQWAADAVIQNNIILGARANGIASQPHQGATPSALSILHNTVIAPQNDALSIRGATGAVLVANNALYAMSGRSMFVNGSAMTIRSTGNVGMGAQSGISGGYAMGEIASDFIDADFSGGLPNDVFPASGGALVGGGDVEEVIVDDFNGRQRMGVADVGAYAYGEGGNSGWAIAEEFKGEDAPPPLTIDGGVSMGDGGTTEPGLDGSIADGSLSPDSGADMGLDASGCGCHIRNPRGSTRMWWVMGLVIALITRRRVR